MYLVELTNLNSVCVYLHTYILKYMYIYGCLTYKHTHTYMNIYVVAFHVCIVSKDHRMTF